MVQFQEKCDLSVGSLYDYGTFSGLEQDPREVLGDLGIDRFYVNEGLTLSDYDDFGPDFDLLEHGEHVWVWSTCFVL